LGVQPLVAQVLKSGEPLTQSVVKDGRAFTVRVCAIGEDARGGVLIALREVTELQRLGRARRDFVANISRELRNPVASLQLLAETMSPETFDDRALTLQMMSKLRAQIDILHQLTDELMDLALIESGQAPIKLVETCALDLVKGAVEPLLPQAERKQLRLTITVSPDLHVLADPAAIRKVIGNLAHNAIKFTNSGGAVEIRARRDGENVEFAIADTGVGIPVADLPRIFERFYKVDRARARDSETTRGTGLGLAIAKHMVEAHGGTIRAESVEGKGSTFYFTLPSSD
jgi:two-component system phosphate regulon sensor histidine kinase PhoR